MVQISRSSQQAKPGKLCNILLKKNRKKKMRRWKLKRKEKLRTLKRKERKRRKVSQLRIKRKKQRKMTKMLKNKRMTQVNSKMNLLKDMPQLKKNSCSLQARIISQLLVRSQFQLLSKKNGQ